MNKITLENPGHENLNEDTINLIIDLVKTLEKNIIIDPKSFLFDILHEFSTRCKDNFNHYNKFNYYHLLTALNKLYPGEFQKELLKS